MQKSILTSFILVYSYHLPFVFVSTLDRLSFTWDSCRIQTGTHVGKLAAVWAMTKISDSKIQKYNIKLQDLQTILKTDPHGHTGTH
jgi:hypothetical protein